MKNEIHGPQKVNFRKRGFITGSLGEKKKEELLYNRRDPRKWDSVESHCLRVNKALVNRGRGKMMSSSVQFLLQVFRSWQLWSQPQYGYSFREKIQEKNQTPFLASPASGLVKLKTLLA